jgi:stringent starvation protein B
VTSQRPYLLRALHEWITDNRQTPHVIVDANVPGVSVPRQYVQNGKIVLNIGYSATNGLSMGNEALRFHARFGSSTFDVMVPIQAVLGIYARETGQGMVFADTQSSPEPNPDPASPSPTTPGPTTSSGADTASKRTHLKVVK